MTVLLLCVGKEKTTMLLLHLGKEKDDNVIVACRQRKR